MEEYTGSTGSARAFVRISAQSKLIPPSKVSKRQKVDTACNSCRARKVKCDGVRPTCNVCKKRAKRGAICIYKGDSHRQQVRETVQLSLNRQQHQSPAQGDRSLNQDGSSNVASCVDSMACDIGDQTQPRGFFGSSSAGSFMHQIRSAIDQKLCIKRNGTPKSTSGVQALSGSTPPNFHQRDLGVIGSGQTYSLPPRRTADSLLAVYWSLVYPLYPYLDKEHFEELYESLWKGNLPERDEKLFVSTLNVVLALGCQLSDFIQAEARERNAGGYFKRAQELIQLDLWDIGSTELIQCLLLMGQYLQSTSHPHQCWMVIGHAVRVAQGLGFHLPESGTEVDNVRERELTRRIWHGCVLMDMILSMTFGRPAMVSKDFANTVPLPTMIDLEYLHLGSQPMEKPAIVAFFVSSLKLYSIINDILLEFYTFQEGSNRSEANHTMGEGLNDLYATIDIAAVFKLDCALAAWANDLPPHLHFSSIGFNEDAVFNMQANVCRARFLHARILLFRPVLSHFCLSKTFSSGPRTVPDDSISKRMALQCSGLCLRSAHQLIELIHSNLDREERTGPVPAWWYCIFYTYTAATILLAGRLRPGINAVVSSIEEATEYRGESCKYDTEASWAKAHNVLECFSVFGTSANRCVAALEILDAEVSKVAGTSMMPFRRRGPVVAHQLQHRVHTSHSNMDSNQHYVWSQAGMGSVVGDQNKLGYILPNGFACDEREFDSQDFGGMPAPEFTATQYGFADFDLENMNWLTIMPGDL